MLGRQQTPSAVRALPSIVQPGRILLPRKLRRPAPIRVATPLESTDLDVEARDPRDLGVYVFGERTALHVGFQGPGWTLDKSPETGYIFSLVDYASPGRVRLAFGSTVGKDDAGDTVYDWGRRGWGGDDHCLSNSLGDEKPRFYLTARQTAQILAAPWAQHSFDFHFKGWRGDKDGCPIIQNESDRTGGIAMTKTLTWTPLPTAPLNGANVSSAAPSSSSSSGARGGCGGCAAYEVSLSLHCSDGFSAAVRAELDPADYLIFEECVRFAIPHLLGLHGAFRLPVREDYEQDMIL